MNTNIQQHNNALVDKIKERYQYFNSISRDNTIRTFFDKNPELNSYKRFKNLLKINLRKEDTLNHTNIMNYVIRELKYNMPYNTEFKVRYKIGKQIISHMKENNITLGEAKNVIYKKHNIFITKVVNFDSSITDDNTMYIEREYDELHGKPVYGWDCGEPVYTPTLGVSIDKPTYAKSGTIWKSVLENRWEQRSDIDKNDDENDINEYSG